MVIVWIWFWWYSNYDKLSAADSWIYSEKRLELKEIKRNKKSTEIKQISSPDKWYLYNWRLWRVVKMSSKRKTSASFYERKTYVYSLNKEELKKIAFIIYLKENKIIDTYISEYILENKVTLWEEIHELMNFFIAIKILTPEQANKHITLFQHNYTQLSDEIELLTEKNDFITLAEKLKNIEQSTSIKSENQKDFVKQNILQDERSQYVIKQLTSWDYYSHIQQVSNIFQIDQKLLVSAIGVEQFRYLTTNRAYAKKMIKSNKHLTKFSKFSYGPWWIKVATAREIQDSVKKYNPEIYQKYFQEDVWLKNSALIEKLEDEFWGILYAWALIYSIQERWKQAWFDISHKPGVLITLYNMWNPKHKKPHANPDIWGSIIIVEWDKRYFWEIWELFYYYLKYYILE
jgi:hypothetical protein